MALVLKNRIVEIHRFLRRILEEYISTIDVLLLTFSVALVILSIFLFLSNQGQLRAIWLSVTDQNHWLALFVLPTFYVISTLLYSVAEGSQLRRWMPMFSLIWPSLFFPFALIETGDSSIIFTSLAVVFAALAITAFSLKVLPTVEKSARYRLALGAILVGSWIIPFLVVVLLGQAAFQAVGSAFIVLYFIGNLVITSACVSALKFWDRVVLVVPVLGFFIHDLDHKFILTDLHANPRGFATDADAFRMWLASRGDVEAYASAGRPYPVFVVVSEGGGGFAAAHANATLQSIQSRCPLFGQHLFALIGVSGGAVGNAEFHSRLASADLKDLPNDNGEADAGFTYALGNKAWTPCEGQPEVDLSSSERDHLAPLLGRLLFDEFVRKLLFLPSSDRNRSTELASSFETSIADGPYQRHFWQFEGSPTRARANGLPALIQVATDLSSGHIYPFSPFKLQYVNPGQYISEMGYAHRELGQDVTITHATAASASFPYITPAMRLAIPVPSTTEPSGSRSRLMVDGGYADNSGAFVARALLRSLRQNAPGEWLLTPGSPSGSLLRKVGPPDSDDTNDRHFSVCFLHFHTSPLAQVSWDQCNIHFSVTTILIEARSGSTGFVEPHSNFFLDPLLSLYSVREGRAYQERDNLMRDLCDTTDTCYLHRSIPISEGAIGDLVTEVFKQKQLDLAFFFPDKAELPLGWLMPKDGLDKLAETVVPPDSNESATSAPPDPRRCVHCLLRFEVESILVDGVDTVAQNAN